MNILAHTSHVGKTGYNAHSQGFFRKLSEKTNLKIRNFTIGKNWKGYPCEDGNPHGSDVNDLDKKLLHQQTLWTPEKERKDFPLYNYDSSFVPDVNIILNTVDHYYFYDSYKGYKIAYNVWENSLYPNNFFEKLKEFDQVWVASKWQAQMLVEQGFFAGKIKVVPEAVDSKIYFPKKTKYNDNKFRFIIFGAWSDRKSTKEIIQCFIDLFKHDKNVELILSVENGFYNDGCSNTEERLKKYNLSAPNIKILNFPNQEDYISYLQRGHVFLSCARGEGWNIPLIEAMACGTPSIYSNYGGQLEFAQNKGIPVKIKNLVLAEDFEQNKNQNSPGYWCEPDFEDLKKQMLEVYRNYDFYKNKALEESNDIRKVFTWENAADIAMEHLSELDKNNLKVLTHCSFVGTGGFNSLCQNLLPELNNLCNVKVRNYTVAHGWKGYNSTPHDLDIEDEHKKILHLQTLYNSDHSRSDFPIYNYTANFEPQVNLIINELNHYYFYENYRGPKIAYTMYETTEFPNDFVKQLKTFNQIWVPSEWQKECLIKQDLPKDKIKVVPLGVDSKIFNLENKKLKNKFTFAILGRWDERKSTKSIIRCFKESFGNNKNVELLLSVDNPHDIDGLKSTHNRLKHFDLESENIKILNFLNREDYIDHLKSIHVFLSCSKAEGWNLPLIEAMACGVPSIYSECSAQLEFAKNRGIPVKIKNTENASNYISEQFCKNVQGDYYIPDFEDLKKKMLDVYQNYNKFLEKSIEESHFIRDNFSWVKSAKIAFNNFMELNNKNVSFVKFTDNKLGIEYRNNSIFNVKAKIKFFDEKTNFCLYEDSFWLDGNCEYFSALNNTKNITGPVVFNVYDEKDNLFFSVKNEVISTSLEKNEQSSLINLNFDTIYCDKSIDLSGLSFKYDKQNNTLYYYTSKDIKDVILIAKDLRKNLNLCSIFNRKDFSIIRGWEYNIYPTKDQKLDLDIFTGFKFIAYKNNKLLFNIEIPIDKTFKKNKHAVQFVFDPETDLALHDNFFSQSLDFYSKPFYKKAVKENMIIIDIGASCGTFADFCLSRKAKKIIALEPSKSFDVLQKTFCDFNNVFCENQALSNENGEIELITCEDSTLTSFDIEKQKEADYENNFKHKNFNALKIKSINLETLLEKHCLQTVDLLKMDIEGFEYKIFKSLNNEIIKKIKSFIIEYHHNDGAILNDCIIKKLKDNGFHIEGYNLQCQATDSLSDKKGIIYAFQEKTIHIVNESGSLGDNIAWVPVVDHFQKIKNCKIKYYTPYKELFEKTYPNIEFHNYNEKPINSDYSLGCFDVNGIRWNQFNLQELAFKILGLEYFEIQPKISLPDNLKNKFNKKYVCIGSLSTCQAKFWNNPDGWNQIVDYVKSLGYEVISIDKNNNIGYGEHINHIPFNSIDETGDKPLSDRINDLYFCEFFIGLGSGLSWLAWGLNKPVIMISGFSDPKSEFHTPYRVHNKNVCNSCWNDINIYFDKNNWAWCPRNKNFECTKEISFEMVKEKINLLIKDIEKPKILLKHLICDRKGKKELLSIENIKSSFSLIENFNYSIKDSILYNEIPEKIQVFENNNHWIELDKKHDEFGLTARHYGCYKAHIDAILEFFNDENDYDYLVIAEGDAKILVDPQNFKKYFDEAIRVLDETDYKIFTFGKSVHGIDLNKKIHENIYEIDCMWGTYLYIFSKKHKYYFKYIIEKYGWHAFDWWLNLSFEKEKQKFLKFNTDEICFEFDGYSYIDKVEKKY